MGFKMFLDQLRQLSKRALQI